MKLLSSVSLLSLAGSSSAAAWFDKPQTPANVRGADAKATLLETVDAQASHETTLLSPALTTDCGEHTDACIIDDHPDGTFRKCWQILAGNTIFAGTFCISTDEFEGSDTFRVTFNSSGSGWHLEEASFWAGEHGSYPQTLSGIPRNTYFPVRSGPLGDPRPTTYAAELPFERTGSIDGATGRVSPCCAGVSPTTYQLLAHCKVYNSAATQTEISWGNATEIGANWALGTNFTLGCDCDLSSPTHTTTKRKKSISTAAADLYDSTTETRRLQRCKLERRSVV